MATVKRRGDSWQLNWSENGRQRRKSLGQITAGEAEACRLAKELELQTGRRIFVAAPLFEEFLQEYLDWHGLKYPDSHQRVKQICEQCFTEFLFRPLSEIQQVDIEKWLAQRETRTVRNRLKQRAIAASETAVKELRTLKAVLNKAVEWGRGIAKSPAEDVKPPKNKRSAPIHWYSREELQKLYGDQVEFAPVWRLMANTGMRRSEAQQLRWADVKLEQGHLHVLSTEDERTKSGKWREIPMSEAARLSLLLLQTYTGDQEHVLPRMTGPSLSRHFLRDARRLGLRGSLHSLRHSYGAHLVMEGVPLRTVQELMGHASIVTTEKYAHLAKSHLKEQAKKLSI
jgi:integrase